MRLFCIDCKKKYETNLKKVEKSYFTGKCEVCNGEQMIGSDEEDCRQCKEFHPKKELMGGKCRDCNMMNKAHVYKIKYGKFEGLTFRQAYERSPEGVKNSGYDTLVAYGLNMEYLEKIEVDFRKFIK